MRNTPPSSISDMPLIMLRREAKKAYRLYVERKAWLVAYIQEIKERGLDPDEIFQDDKPRKIIEDDKRRTDDDAFTGEH